MLTNFFLVFTAISKFKPNQRKCVIMKDGPPPPQLHSATAVCCQLLQIHPQRSRLSFNTSFLFFYLRFCQNADNSGRLPCKLGIASEPAKSMVSLNAKRWFFSQGTNDFWGMFLISCLLSSLMPCFVFICSFWLVFIYFHRHQQNLKNCFFFFNGNKKAYL